jgi:hypothetical protein
MRELSRMFESFEWNAGQDPRAHTARRELREALVVEFNSMYGTDARDLAAWQKLCRVLRVDVPETRKECQKVWVELPQTQTPPHYPP